MKGIQQASLEKFFAQHVEGAVPPLSFSMITGGHSNLTYLVEDASGRKTVLRRPPTGAVLATAHDMAREHRIISSLGGSAVPVPRTLALCQDESVNDAPFYVMDYVEGSVLTSPEQTADLVPEAKREKLGLHIIEVLAALHRIEPSDIGLGDLGRREAYLARQLKRWKTQWEKSKTRELPQMEEAHAQLEARMPEQKGATIVHGDYRIGNFLSNGPVGKIEAVLDWELCTLGDPLADVGYLMNDWNGPDDHGPTASGTGQSAVSCGGFPDRHTMLARYEELTGTSTQGVDYYRAFQYWRLAAIVEGVLARYLKGVMGENADTAAFKAQVDSLANAAVALASSADFS
jgi:aminoglycoside phosphotransferase (APT) family kinase protein